MINTDDELVNIQIWALPVEPLSETEIDALLFMREEEKLARDVYDHLFTIWSLKIFNNISASEQSHTDAVRTLLNKYELEDPAINRPPGVFVNQELQTLYTELIQVGSVSLESALKVGAAIEEIDILDLQRELSSNVDNEDIILVFENLMKGSKNHLKSFVLNLKKQNIAYVPQYLTQEEFEVIINS
ncbi:hypothetical protein AWN68_15015 [Roseivirga echinicomitans]|uniref:DUF2202 domain-containing protein n=2 Tax=Roseivirga echinicomitans TaxID=296218 RepID=A0A150XUX7_9BACT|nr:hypothetical protein AWN68_15015 [Roseivirga echinicomitans]